MNVFTTVLFQKYGTGIWGEAVKLCFWPYMYYEADGRENLWLT